MKRLILIRGDKRVIPINFKNDAGDPIDITGCTVYFTARAKSTMDDANDTTALFTKSVTSHTNAANGQTSVTLEASDLDEVGVFYFDIQILFSNGIKKSIIKGLLEITQDVTKA